MTEQYHKLSSDSDVSFSDCDDEEKDPNYITNVIPPTPSKASNSSLLSTIEFSKGSMGDISINLNPVVAKPLFSRRQQQKQLQIKYVGDTHYIPGTEFNDGSDKIKDVEKVEYKEFVSQKKLEIEQKLTDFFGVNDPIKSPSNFKREYEYLCPVKGCNERSLKLNRHLISKKHNYPKKKCFERVERNVTYVEVSHSG